MSGVGSAHAEYVAAAARNCLKLPDKSIDWDNACCSTR